MEHQKHRSTSNPATHFEQIPVDEMRAKLAERELQRQEDAPPASEDKTSITVGPHNRHFKARVASGA